jgi:large subunit ribosomal protein L20
MRVKRGIVRRAKHKKVIKKAKGYTGRRKSVFKLAKQAVLKAGQYAYRDRKNKKRVFRAAWIVRINAATRQYGMSYSTFISRLAKAKIIINRKMLAEMIEKDPQAFKELAKKVK